MKHQHQTVMAAATAIVALLLGANPINAQDETQVYGIARFGGPSRCESAGDTHTVHTSTAAAFASVFGGGWTVHTRNDLNARGSYFTDSSKAATCGCTGDDVATDSGADEADVIYVHTHGNHSTMAPWFSELSMGNKTYVCRSRTDRNMLWNSDLDIAVVKACQSGDYDVWQNGGYYNFRTSTSGFRMWNAFHGDSSCGSHVTFYVLFYTAGSFYDGVGENWLDWAYDVDWGSNNDDCPVSIVFGDTRAKRVSLFENGGWKDRKATGAKTASTYFYFEGCNPDNGRKLPD
jgi:hypothetical protein